MGTAGGGLSVVVRKSEPMKAGDSAEGKTRMSVCKASYNLPLPQKGMGGGEGTCPVKVVSERERKS